MPEQAWEKPSVAIAYDSRNKSELLPVRLRAYWRPTGVTAHIYPWLSPTPTLSYAVRYLKCDAGICVTASHNPAKYNGYKAYGADGCQVTAEMADDILNEINAPISLRMCAMWIFRRESRAG